MLELTCPEFKNGESIPQKYTCDGPNISPPLHIKKVPLNAKSLVLIIEDPSSTIPWVHWLVFNIPPSATEFKENNIPEGATEGLCNGNTFGYEGPCPPENKHTYEFQLYALDIVLELKPESDK